jgi:hypothetical protein
LPFFSICCSAAADGQEPDAVKFEPYDPRIWLIALLVGQAPDAPALFSRSLREHVAGAARALDMSSIAMTVVAIRVTSIILFVFLIVPSFHSDSFTLLRILVRMTPCFRNGIRYILIYKCT